MKSDGNDVRVSKIYWKGESQGWMYRCDVCVFGITDFRTQGEAMRYADQHARSLWHRSRRRPAPTFTAWVK